MNKSLQIIGILSLFLLTVSCKKYEDGPRFSLKSKKARVAGSWKLDKRFINDVEQSLTNDDRDDVWEYKKNNDFVRTSPGNDAIAGNWEFDGNKDNIIISYSVSMFDNGGNLVTTQVQEIYEILRLKENELWLEQTINGDKVESHFIPS